MSELSKEFELELKDDRLVNVTITVKGDYESDYGGDADGNRGVGAWFINSHSYEADEELLDQNKLEVDLMVEELVNDEDWDFDEIEEDHQRDED